MIEYVVVYPSSVEGSTKRLPLVLKKQPEHLKGMLNLPGGKVKPGENPVDAAIRELKEETGLDEVQVYDPMCVCSSEYVGVIMGVNSIIHCVRVPVSSRQELNPGPEETEDIKWYNMPELLNEKYLMPNLRLTIPLIENGAKDWVIEDLDGNWRKQARHTVMLQFGGMINNSIRVAVNSVGSYLEEEE